MTEITLPPSNIDNLLLSVFSNVCNSLKFNLPSTLTADLPAHGTQFLPLEYFSAVLLQVLTPKNLPRSCHSIQEIPTTLVI